MRKIFILIAFIFQCGVAFAQSGKIFTTSKNVIECSYIQNKRFGVEYIKVNSNDNTKDYIPHSKIDRIEYDNGDIEYISGSPTKDQKSRNKKDPKDFTYLNPSYLSLNVGAAFAFPGLDFYSQYLGNGAGQTGTGVQVSIDGMYSPDIFAGFGLGGFVGYTYNPINPVYFTSILQNQLPASANNISIKTQGWNNIYFLAGADYYLETNSRWMFDAKVLLGGMYSFHPTASATYDDSSGVNKTTTLSSESLFLCFGAQASARYFITRKFSLKASLNLMYSYGGFSQLTRNDYQDSKLVYTSNALGPGRAAIEWVGISLGVAYTLGK
jgi:hypothetical protein